MTRLAILLALVTGCGPERLAPDTLESGAVRYDDGSTEAELVLRAANELPLTVLDDEVPLDSRAAQGIVATRAGTDGIDGTSDDTPFQSLATLDAVLYVGDSAIEALLSYARTLWANGGAVHGYAEGGEDAEAILGVANTGTHHVLEVRVGLSERVAWDIVDGRAGPDGRDATSDDRPYLTLAELDAVDLVDGEVFDRLLAWAATQAPPVEACPDGSIVSSDGKTTFRDLKSAVQGSPAGTVLDVCAGTFVYSGLPADGLVPDGLTLRGRGPDTTVLVSSNRLFTLHGGDTSTLEALTVTSTSNAEHVGSAGIVHTDDGSALVVRDVVFTGNSRTWGGALYADGGVDLQNVTFSDNYARTGGGAIYAGSTSRISLREVTFSSNEADSGDGGGIYVEAGAVLDLHDVTFSDQKGAAIGGPSEVAPVATASTITGLEVRIVDTDGPAIQLGTTTLTLTDSELLANVAAGTCGGVSLSADADATFVARNVDFGVGNDDNTTGDVCHEGRTYHYGNGVDVDCAVGGPCR